ncbi:MAG: virulence-associated E family protein [Alphaproteobacteria bacterium]|nr:virulence-associated E family protein [Alphaproteobacteria bacterium]
MILKNTFTGITTNLPTRDKTAMKVSIFRNFNQVVENLDISVILEQIRSGKYKSRVLALRELLRQGKTEEYNDAKRSLPAFTPSGLFEGGRKLEYLKEYSGLIILDIDKLTQDQLIATRSSVEEIPNTHACFISPSGKGLKILVKVFSRPVYHKVVFSQVKSFYEEQLRNKDQDSTVQIDPSGKDITRLCFVSWDEMLYLNPSAAIFKPYINMVEDDLEKLVSQIESRQIDLTSKYEDWVKIGFALTDALGEEGRSAFHRISQFYPGYNINICDEQYDKCLKSKRSGITIATLYYFARDSGIEISKFKTAPETIIKSASNGPALNLGSGTIDPAFTTKANADPDENPNNSNDLMIAILDPIPGEITNESQLKKKKRKNQIDTIEAYLSNHYQLRYNIVTSKLEIRKFANSTSFVPLTDYQENSLLREILKSNLKCSATLLRSILYSDFSNFYDPFQDYFLHLPLWVVQTDYIQQLAETVTTTSQDLWCKCFKKWLVASVAAVLDHKTVNHTAIILSGPQGVGKTTWMLNLCPPELSDYIFSGTINPNNKDTLIHLAECMFINMDELENMNRSEIGAFKEIITKSAIRMRRAYGHHIEAFTRRASFMGSVNSSQFLTDSTGSRRFLCFEIISINYQHAIDLRMVYAQAYDLFQQGFKFYFDKSEIEDISLSNEQFQINTVEEELLLTYFQKVPLLEATHFLSASQILNRITERTHVNIATSPGAVIRIGKALKKFGFEKRKTDGIYIWAIQERSSLPSIS